MKKNIKLSLISGMLISAVALYFAFRKVPLDDLLNYLMSINYFWILPSMLVVLMSFVLRAFRWQIILGSAREISFRQAFHPMMIGFMLNCILPGRIGEMARPAILHKNNNFPFPAGLATVAAERVLDVSLLIVLLIAVLTIVQIDPDFNIAFGEYNLSRKTLTTIGGNMLKMSIILIAGIFMISFNATRNIINRAIMKIPSLLFFAGYSYRKKIQKKVCAPLVYFAENFASGFALVKYPKKMCACIGLSVIIWSLLAFSYYIMALGCPGIDLTYFEISAVMIIICFFIAIPSVPGFWGIWEAGGVFALSLFGVSSKDAAGFTLANHAIQILPVIGIGFVSAMITGVNIWRVSYNGHENK